MPGMDPIGAVLIENSILLPLNDFKNSRGKLTPTEANSRVLRVRKCSGHNFAQGYLTDFCWLIHLEIEELDCLVSNQL